MSSIGYTEANRALFLSKEERSCLIGAEVCQVNIQIFGKNKCFDTKKAQRYFKERRIKFQYVDIQRFGMSRGELTAVKNAVGLAAMSDAPEISYLAYDEDKLEKLFEYPELLKTPIVRNGKQATVGYCPDVWKSWE